MYDRTKHLCLTAFEAQEIGQRAAVYIGIPRQDIELFGAVFQHMIESFLEQLKEEAATTSGRKPKKSNGGKAGSLP